MVRIAEKKSLYKSLKVFDPDTKIPIYSEQYKIITAIGVIGAGAAPVSYTHLTLPTTPYV